MAVADAALNLRRKRLMFRAWHRGIRETDLILGRFADAHAAAFTLDEMAEFERLLDVPDPDILAWVSGAAPIPDDQGSPMLKRILVFHGNAD
jgi:antitoxin CptB